ncbi:MAG: adenosine kinase [archaeon]|jgi:sugar/nucleoside kinase (ribokinase family)
MDYDIVGFGSSILDITVNVNDEFLLKNNLTKGNFLLIDDTKSKKLHEELTSFEVIQSPGGSVSNTIAGAALLGANVAYIGGIGNDELGKIYKEQTLQAKVKELFIEKIGTSTGECIACITPDGERTFAVNLGGCNVINKDEITLDFKTKIMHIEGYKLENPIEYETAKVLAKYVKANGGKISLDVNDAGVISRMGEKMGEFIKENVDILFMNEGEAKALTGSDDANALDKFNCEIIVLKIGEEGSVVKQNGKRTIIAPRHVDNLINTNGAGDAYEAAFLYGLTKGYSTRKIGLLASEFAASVVEISEARVNQLNDKTKELLG